MPNIDTVQSNLLKALADENRLRLARLLSHEELNVQELCEILEMAQPKVSRHLSVLRQAGLVADHREGSRVYYSLSSLAGELEMIAEYLRSIAEQGHPDLERMEACLRRRTRISRDFAQQRADEWDEIGIELHSTTAALIAMAHLAPGGLVLADLGTGTGLMLPVLASFADKVYAVDHSEEMLDHARRRCEEHALDNVEFLCCDLGEFADQVGPACDCLLLHFVLHQLARPAANLKAAGSALKPGGKLVVVDRTKHDDEEARQRFGSLWLGFDEDAISPWLRRAGLGQLRFQSLRVQDRRDQPLSLFIASGAKPA